MTKYTKIAEEYFETIKSNKTNNMINYHIYNYKMRNIFSHYVTKPSDTKISIWRNWLEWLKYANEYLSLYEQSIKMFEVTSASTFTFTINALLYDANLDDFIGIITITKNHNRLTLRNDLNYGFEYESC